MKWLKKWFYLLTLTGMGMLYLTCIDRWQVYAEPLQQVKGWYEGLREEGTLLADGEIAEKPGEAVPDEEGQAGESQPPEGSAADGAAAEGGVQESLGESGETGENPMEPIPETGEATSPPEGVPPVGTEPTEPPEEQPVQPPVEGEAQEPEGNPEGAPEGEAPEGAAVEYMAVEDDYFSDAVFIGDSRTVGMYEYAGLEETAAFYASTGLTVYKLFDSQIVSVPGERQKMTVEEALQQNYFAKIYLMIGINEMGTGTVDTFIEKYREVVAHLQELQPDAIIYLQAIIKVTTERSNQGDYINNEGIMARNEGIAQIADNQRVFYLDVNPLICDETGGMVPEYTFDGVHLKAKYIDIWKDFLKAHAVVLP